MTDKRVKYVILAKKKGKGHAVEEHTAYNERAKERIVENLQMDNYKVKVLTRKSFTEKSMDSISRMVNNFQGSELGQTPLTHKEKKLLRSIEREYRKKGYSLDRAQKIARAVVYSNKRRVERM